MNMNMNLRENPQSGDRVHHPLEYSSEMPMPQSSESVFSSRRGSRASEELGVSHSSLLPADIDVYGR